MKLKATITRTAPRTVIDALASSRFAAEFMRWVAGGVFGAVNPHLRPAEYYVQDPDVMSEVTPGVWGVILTLSGVSRGNREPKRFHEALKRLTGMGASTIQLCLEGKQAVQLFVNIMIDGDVPTSPPSGSYSSILESKAVWVTSEGIQDNIPEWLMDEPAPDDSVVETAPIPEPAHADD